MGHSLQVVSVLASAAATFFAAPLSARIHEGLVFSNRDKRTLPKKFLSSEDFVISIGPSPIERISLRV